MSELSNISRFIPTVINSNPKLGAWNPMTQTVGENRAFILRCHGKGWCSLPNYGAQDREIAAIKSSRKSAWERAMG